MTIDFKVDFDFFKNSLKRLIEWNEQTNILGDLLNADIYGGPLKSYSDELDMWHKILDNEEKYSIFVSFIGDLILPEQAGDKLTYCSPKSDNHLGTFDHTYYNNGAYDVDLCELIYPEGKDKYEFIWEVLCS